MGVIVRQKVKGKGQPWWVFVAHNGRRTSRRVGSKEAAEKVRSAIEIRLELGEFDWDEEKKEEKPEPTFKEYADSWIATIALATCKESTVSSYDDLLRLHILPVFGSLRLREINRGRLKEFFAAKILEGYAKSSVVHMKNAISGILTKAVDDEVIPANLTGGIKIVKKANGEDGENGAGEKADPLSAEEVNLLLNTVRADDSKAYPLSGHYPLFLLLVRTGLRIGEALALRWGDIDFNGRFIHVQRGLSRGKIQTPKNGKTRRVDMSPQLAEVLVAYKIECKRKGLTLGLGCEPEYVFTNFDSKSFEEFAKLTSELQGKNELTTEEEAALKEAREEAIRKSFVDLSNWRRRIFNKALEKATLRRIRIHDLRHTYATLRISKGDNIADVSNQLGHYSVKLTLDIYNHWLPGKKKAEVDGLDTIGQPREEEKKAQNEK
jgi:integrase